MEEISKSSSRHQIAYLEHGKLGLVLIASYNRVAKHKIGEVRRVLRQLEERLVFYDLSRHLALGVLLLRDVGRESHRDALADHCYVVSSLEYELSCEASGRERERREGILLTTKPEPPE